MNILAIDTSTSSLSVCVKCDDKILGEINLDNGLVHSTSLMPAIENLFDIINFDKKMLDMVAVCVGPGSFTGIRIGVATANAFSMALNIPVISVDSLHALAMSSSYFDGLIISTIDAQRENYYVGMFDGYDNKIAKRCENQIMSDEELQEYISGSDEKILLIGDAIEVLEEVDNVVFANAHENVIKSSNIAVIADSIRSDSSYAVPVYMRKSQAEIEYNKKHKNG